MIALAQLLETLLLAVLLDLVVVAGLVVAAAGTRPPGLHTRKRKRKRGF